eukprot:3183738-Pyramimonas_sp.AAC.1
MRNIIGDGCEVIWGPRRTILILSLACACCMLCRLGRRRGILLFAPSIRRTPESSPDTARADALWAITHGRSRFRRLEEPTCTLT